jgi:hypothetical protein
VIDTVGLSVEASGLDVADLERRGWDVRSTRMHRGGEVIERVKAFVTRTDGVTLEWYDDVHWLTVRGSLPRVLGLTNDVILSWPDTVRALAVVTGDVASEMTGQPLPWLDGWGVWRVDPVWAWPCDPGPYIDALRMARLARTQTVSEPGSVRWRSLKSGAIYGRFYDKSKEAGRSVPLPARLERQVRPKRQTVRVDGDPVGGKASDLSESLCMGVLASTLRRFGLDRPIPSVMASKRVLVDAWGPRKGGNLWQELLTFSVCGGWPADYSQGKVRRIERECRAAGIGALSLDGELPPLAFPSPV